jgi:hypothetical protein
VCPNSKVDMQAMVHGKHHLISKLLNKSHTIKMAEHIKLPLMIFPNQK